MRLINISLHKLHLILFLFLSSRMLFSQAPDLRSTESFALFTGAGAFSNNGATNVIGDIGTNVGAYSGFPPGIVLGIVHLADLVSAQAAADVLLVYSDLASVACGQVIGANLGNGQILGPDVYCIGSAATLNGELILDGQGDENALFIIQINGALSTSTLTKVTLINGASSCNVYWQVNGQFELGEGSAFNGTLIANGAIRLLEASSLTGRAISTAGAISLFNNVVNVSLQTVASTINALGPTTFCQGGSVTLTGNIGGIWNNGVASTTLIVTAGDDYYVVNSGICGNDTSNHIIVTVNDLPNCSIAGVSSICAGSSTALCVADVPGNSYAWSTGSTLNCIL